MNIRFFYRGWLRGLAVSAAAGLVLVGLLVARPRPPASAAPDAEQVSFTAVREIMDQRCMTCHSATPSDSLFTTPPMGVTFDTPEQIKSMVARIKERAVVSRTMPLGNKTGMTDEERVMLGRWIDQGADTR